MSRLPIMARRHDVFDGLHNEVSGGLLILVVVHLFQNILDQAQALGIENDLRHGGPPGPFGGNIDASALAIEAQVPAVDL